MGVGLRREADLIGSCQRIPDPLISSSSETFRAVDHGHTKGLGFGGWLDKVVKLNGLASIPDIERLVILKAGLKAALVS